MRRWKRRAVEAEKTVEAVRIVASWWAGDTGGDFGEDRRTAAAVLRGVLAEHDRRTDRDPRDRARDPDPIDRP